MNSVNFVGRLDSEPKLLGMPGRDVCEFWLAVTGFKGNQTLHVRVLSFKERAVHLAEKLSVGDVVALSGRLRSEADPERPRTYCYSVIVTDLRRVCGGGRKRGADEPRS
jgi:single-stranded DNA-binding protein